MKPFTFAFLTCVLGVNQFVSSLSSTKRSAPQRTVFSRYANSRFPFFTVDLARLHNKVPSSGRKRAFESGENAHDDTDAVLKDVKEDGDFEIDLPTDMAEGFGMLDARRFGDWNVITEEFAGYEDPLMPGLAPAVDKRSDFKKRIHTCAFMRRLGVPIGLCFNNLRRLNEENRNKVQAPSPRSNGNPYKYLQRQWQGHTMLGGGVGRR